MAKLSIAKAQVLFPMTVDIPTPHGVDQVAFEAKHFKASDWAKMREEHTELVNKSVKALFDAARTAAEDEFKATNTDPKLTDEEKEAAIVALEKPVKQSELVSLKNKISAQLMAKVFTKWDLDDTLSETSLAEMCDLYPGSVDSVFTKYNEALEGVRLGNSGPLPAPTSKSQ